MECRTLAPSMNGTKCHQHQMGDRSLFARHRHDKQRERRHTIAELITDDKQFLTPGIRVEKALFPHPNPDTDKGSADKRIDKRIRGGSTLKRWFVDLYKGTDPLNLDVSVEGDAWRLLLKYYSISSGGRSPEELSCL